MTRFESCKRCGAGLPQYATRCLNCNEPRQGIHRPFRPAFVPEKVGFPSDMSDLPPIEGIWFRKDGKVVIALDRSEWDLMSPMECMLASRQLQCLVEQWEGISMDDVHILDPEKESHPGPDAIRVDLELRLGWRLPPSFSLHSRFKA